MKKMEEVFKISGIPTYTFVEPLEYNKLFISLRTPGRGLVIEGPSGIGKTTCILKVIEKLSLNNKVLKLTSRKKEDIELINELPSMKDIGLVLVDDFHRLEDNLKLKISDYMKTLADEEDQHSKLIVIGINKAGDTLIKFASDLTGRIDTIHFEANPDEKIEELITKGENNLSIKFNIKKDIIKEAKGSFHIAQMLCHETCLNENIFEESEKGILIETSIEIIKNKVLENLSNTFFEKARIFATGPKLRRDGRAPYFHLLNWLGTEDEWALEVDRILSQKPDYRGSVGQIIEKGYLIEHLRKNPSLLEVFHYDNETKVLSVEDPKFVYFLRNILWSKFAKKIGYKWIEFDSKYDFALSFAGEVRNMAEILFNKLTEYELSVFYDKNEQHRILAKNIEDYLSPIYKTEAQFVVVFLSPEYPKKIWTKFESEQFKSRFGENSVIPIILSNVKQGYFDESISYGGYKINIESNIEEQINEISEMLYKKIGEERNSKLNGIVG